jgi:GNAT superfamily N-acetyltransferase
MNTLDNIEDNFFAVGRYWGGLNSSLIQAGSTAAMHTGVAISDMNWAWNEKPLTDIDIEFIEKIKEFYKQQNLRFRWWVYPRGNSKQTVDILQNAGLRLIQKIPCMATNLDSETMDEKIPENITISEVADKNALQLWTDISFHGFEMFSRTKEQYSAFVASFELGSQSPQKLFLAYRDGQAAATSLLFINNNTAGIYYVATLRKYRHKGLGFYITLAAMQAAKELGFKNVILQASPFGFKVYQRMGFKEYCQAEIYKL